MTEAASWPLAWFDTAAERGTLAWRGVEAQHVVATMRLVDTLEEQLLLEQLLEASKPAAAGAGKHFLLHTPFRYRSPTASRFRQAGVAGVWYGAETQRAAAAEVAYWRWRFLVASEGLREQALFTEHTFFRARIDGLALDLSEPPWSALREQWTRDRDYAPTQALAEAARRHGAMWLRYESVREPGARCAAVLVIDALQSLDAASQQTWHGKTTRQHVMLVHGDERHEWRFEPAP